MSALGCFCKVNRYTLENTYRLYIGTAYSIKRNLSYLFARMNYLYGTCLLLLYELGYTLV